MGRFSLRSLFSAKNSLFTLPVPAFSNFRRENNVNLADVKMIPTEVTEQEYKKLKKLGCCDFGCDTKVLSERQLENWNDRLSQVCCQSGSSKYIDKVSVALFNASFSMRNIQDPAVNHAHHPLSLQAS